MQDLKKLRETLGKSQAQVANDLGVTRQCYNNYELGNRQPDYEALAKIAQYFNVTVDYLLGNETEPKETDIKIDGMYFKFAKDAKAIDLSQEDMDFIIKFYKEHKK